MSKPPKFTISHLNSLYPTDDACLDALYAMRYADTDFCPSCGVVTKFYRVTDRKCYACPWCAYQRHPLADTIFHKSSTPLKLWFHAMFLFASAKNGVSAKELQRQIGVTYKTAWRMAAQIRKLCEQHGDILGGIVEVDETYIGGRRKGPRGRGAKGKTPVVGLVERGGGLVVKATTNTTAGTLLGLIHEHTRPDTTMVTDEYVSYARLPQLGYAHYTVQHGIGQYVNGEIHTNTIEGFWSQLKRSFRGTYHSVSPKYLQTYVNEFVFRYNHRNHHEPMFCVMLQRASQPPVTFS